MNNCYNCNKEITNNNSDSCYNCDKKYCIQCWKLKNMNGLIILTLYCNTCPFLNQNGCQISKILREKDFEDYISNSINDIKIN